jgi:hypothetical protein
MISVGCALTSCLFVALVCGGAGAASRRGTGSWLGALWGLVTFVAVMSGYAASLTVRDWLERHKYPNRIGIPRWGIAAVWAIFAASGLLSFLLWRRVNL